MYKFLLLFLPLFGFSQEKVTIKKTEVSGKGTALFKLRNEGFLYPNDFIRDLCLTSSNGTRIVSFTFLIEGEEILTYQANSELLTEEMSLAAKTLQTGNVVRFINITALDDRGNLLALPEIRFEYINK